MHDIKLKVKESGHLYEKESFLILPEARPLHILIGFPAFLYLMFSRLISSLCFQPLTHVYAKNLATFVSQEASNRPVLLGLALKDSSIDAIKQMKEIIKSCQVW